MATARADSYTAASGAVIYGGMTAPPTPGPAPAPAPAPAPLQIVSDGIWGNDGDQGGAIEYGGAVYVGMSSNAGTGPRVAKHVVATDTTTLSPTLNSSIGASDHSAPFLQIRSDGRIVAFYCAHNDTTAMRYRISTNPEDVSAWGPEQQLTTGFTQVTYPYVVVLSAALWVMFFRNESNFFYRTSTNEGSTWSGAVHAFQYAPGGRPYVLPMVNGSRIECFLMQQDSSLTLLKTIHHVYATASGSVLSFFKTDGTALAAPVQTTDGTVVYDGTGYPSSGYMAATIGPGGVPWLLVKRINSSSSNTLQLVRQSGTSWLAPVTVADGGTPVTTTKEDYTGCACFMPGDPTRVYSSRGEAANGPWELAVYRTLDGGATWAKERDITAGSASGVRNMRPASIKGGSKYKVAYLRGGYTDFTTFSTAVWLGA